MMETYGISAKKLAVESGVSEITISRFRRGKQPMTTENLDTLLMAVPAEARIYFFKILTGEIVEAKCPTLQDMVLEAKPHQLTIALQIIGARLNDLVADKNVSQNTKTKEGIFT